MADRTDWIVMGPGLKVRPSLDHVDLDSHRIPRRIEVERTSHGEPTVYACVDVTNSGPRVTDLRFYVDSPYARDVMQRDLRDFRIAALVEELVTAWTSPLGDEVEGEQRLRMPPKPGTRGYSDALRVIERSRAGRTSREITPELLERVAAIYRDNIRSYPTKAVQHHFQVSQRMAAEYVSRARKRGLLPPTKKGKKNA